MANTEKRDDVLVCTRLGKDMEKKMAKWLRELKLTRYQYVRFIIVKDLLNRGLIKEEDLGLAERYLLTWL